MPLQFQAHHLNDSLRPPHPYVSSAGNALGSNIVDPLTYVSHALLPVIALSLFQTLIASSTVCRARCTFATAELQLRRSEMAERPWVGNKHVGESSGTPFSRRRVQPAGGGSGREAGCRRATAAPPPRRPPPPPPPQPRSPPCPCRCPARARHPRSALSPNASRRLVGNIAWTGRWSCCP